MAIQTVNTGTTPNDGTGDPARTAFTKINDNFTQPENAASHLLLGTVSQSGGVPTGAIIERGSNANGNYVKYADGTMICFYVAGYTIPNSNEVSVPWTFPSTFIDTGYISIAQWKGPAPGAAAVFYSNSSHTVTSVTFTATTIDGSVFMEVGSVREAAFVAIGRWY